MLSFNRAGGSPMSSFGLNPRVESHLSLRESIGAVDRRYFLHGAGALASLGILPTPTSASDSGVFEPAPGSLTGTTIFVTGANTGLGLESAKRLAAAGARVILSARSKEKAEAAVNEVKSTTKNGEALGIELDLASLDSINSLPKRLEEKIGGSLVIDVLLNNAGVMAVPQRVLTSDGFEKTLGINHLGHFALTAALFPALQEAKNGFRVVTVSSDAHRFADKSSITKSINENLDPPDYAVSGWGAYGVSKAANVLFTVELQRRIEAAGIKGSAVALHPGVVQTDLTRYVTGGLKAEDAHPTQTAEKPTGVGKFLKEGLLDKVVIPVDIGANTQVYLAAASDTNGDRTSRGGLFFDKMKSVAAADAASDSELAKEMWSVSEKLTKRKFDI